MATFLAHECGLLWQQDKRKPQLGILSGVEGKCSHQRPHHTPFPPQPDCICSIKPHLSIMPRDGTAYEMIPYLLHPTPIRPFPGQSRALYGTPSFTTGNSLERRLSHASRSLYVERFLLVRSGGNWRQSPETCIQVGTTLSHSLKEMDVDQDVREFQRQYLDFLDDAVSTAKIKRSQKYKFIL